MHRFRNVLLGVIALAPAAGCTTASPPVGGSGGADASGGRPAVDGGNSGSGGEPAFTPDPVGEFMGIPPEPGAWTPSPWTAIADDPNCKHVDVEANCENGYCRIPAGCFVMGPRPGEYAAPSDEYQVTIHLTQDFEIGQTELTWREWEETSIPRPERGMWKDPPAPCDEADCPATGMTWYEIVQFANAKSRLLDLEECYLVEGCVGELGGKADAYECASVKPIRDDIYSCKGYRLPTEFEWEYAARAGTQTAYHQGDIPSNGDGVLNEIGCFAVEALGVSDWYCANSEYRIYPVARKKPNRWGLYDILGNLNELTGSSVAALPKDRGMRTNPGAAHTDEGGVEFRAGSMIGGPAICRVSSRLGVSRTGPAINDGFRLARSLN